MSDQPTAPPSSADLSTLPGARKEDRRLLTGRGRYVADRMVAGACHGVVVRCPHAHARIADIDIRAAVAGPGVLAVLAADDAGIAALGRIPWELPPPGEEALAGARMRSPLQPVMAQTVARYSGEPVAFVVARTLGQAQDAAELVRVVYEPLDCVTAPHRAVAAGAPVIWPEFPDNVYFHFRKGDERAVDAAFSAAAHVARVEVVNNRLAANPMEPREYLGTWDRASDRWTLYAAAGKPHLLKRVLGGAVLGVDPDRIRVVVEDVGGGFGAKNHVYPEQALVLIAARRIGRPVRWTASRSEMMLSDAQGRDQVSRAALALDADGTFRAVRVSSVAALGAYVSPRGVVSPIAGGRTLPGVYAIPSASLDVRAAFTNTVPTAPYRGAGQPEIMFLIERLVDVAARRLKRSPADLRRQNMIPVSRLPFTNALGITYDTGDFRGMLDRACERAAWSGFEGRRREAAARGRLRGIGLSCTIEACGMGIAEEATIRIDETGRPTVLIGTMSNGQSHETVYAQLAAEVIGCRPGDVTVIQGDTDQIASGSGTGASRSLTVGGAALLLACRDLVAKARQAAAELLQSDPSEVTSCPSGFRVVGTGRLASWVAVAAHRHGLEARRRFDPPNYTFPSGCHICELEVDPETGSIEILAYGMVHDVGRAVNPVVVRGQLQGGVVQGIGQALLEQVRYDEAGQVLTGSFLDYAMPHADEMPSFSVELTGNPSPVNPLGAKSVGEAGPTAAPPAVINALLDALAPLGVQHIDMPATPFSVWRSIRAAGEDRPLAGAHPQTDGH